MHLAGCVACQRRRSPSSRTRQQCCSTRHVALTGGTPGGRGAAEGAREEGPAAGGRTDKRAGPARTPTTRNTRGASGKARRVAARKTRSGSGARELYKLEARRGDEAHGAWDGARDAEFGSARTLEEADVWRSVRGDAKMDAQAVVLEELKSGRNSDKLANALSLLTELE